MFFRVGYLSDSMETSISWDKCENVIESMRSVYYEELKRQEIQGNISFRLNLYFHVQTNYLNTRFFIFKWIKQTFFDIRISQVYHDGVCIYLYFGIANCENQLVVFENLSSLVKDTVKVAGGSLSHHHGIGKKNAAKFCDAISDVGKEMLQSLKNTVDPKNVFAAGNLIFNTNKTKFVSKL